MSDSPSFYDPADTRSDVHIPDCEVCGCDVTFIGVTPADYEYHLIRDHNYFRGFTASQLRYAVKRGVERAEAQNREVER
ncbi:hypothetical protein [Haloprofundus salilacus]|uniref:hypothetical protein n=1 Tax=Haloprofundus salilacus TaxID=2876190 RepID=UPI001CCBF861|nr:hypothetical protein [Haloprofundus salilacus]